jgi:CRP/FNR family transcriptional regulator, cyclic AMP receptor protein
MSGPSYTSGTWPIDPGAGSAQKSSRIVLARRIDLLSRVPLFFGLSKSQLRSVAAATSISRFAAGETVVTEGTSGGYLFVIAEGEARVRRGNRNIASLGEGDVFGEISLLDPGQTTASVIAQTELRCIELARKAFVSLLEQNPEISIKLLSILAGRLRAALKVAT